MRPLGLPILADENIHPGVVAALRERGCDVRTVLDVGLGGAADVAVLRAARAEARIVLTHDADFGALALRSGEPIVGIVYLRPGHIEPRAVLETIDAVQARDLGVAPPFIVVAERRGDVVRVRARQLDSDA